jgi:hypothetical protein
VAIPMPSPADILSIAWHLVMYCSFHSLPPSQFQRGNRSSAHKGLP